MPLQPAPPSPNLVGLPGDPNCPLCGGIGYLRQDLPVGHPEFGKAQICSCRKVEASQQARQKLFALSHLERLSHLTFENFRSRGLPGLFPSQAQSLEKAYNMALLFAQNLNGWIVFQGEYGCGKTHLAAAIGNFAVELGVPTLFLTAPDLLDSLRAAYHEENTSFEERLEEVRTAPLLILDDFGTQNATAWAQEKLFQIINYRYINRLPLVVTTNLPMNQIEMRIRSRLEHDDLVTTVKIDAPDYRKKLADHGHPELSSLIFHHERTFASFDMRRREGLKPEELRSLEKAYRAAQEFANSPKGWLVLTGPYGCGKTHLAAAIANHHANLSAPPLFVVVPDLLDHLRAAFAPQSTVSLDRRFEEVRTAPLLVLDDLGTQSMTPWVREKLYQLFNYRYNAELATVITTADSLGEMDPRIRSRMLDRRLCIIYAITAPPYAGAPSPEQGGERKSGRGRSKSKYE